MSWPIRASRHARRLGRFGSWALVLLVGLPLGWWLLTWQAGTPLSQLSESWNRERAVLDRNGKTLRSIPSSLGVRGTPISLETVGSRLITATLVSEDRRFFEHAGVDARAIARAVKQNLAEGEIVSGASTITQQLVKLLDSSGRPGPRGPWLKLVEAARAHNLERELDKREILTAYVNRLNYGRGFMGPERAARGMLGKAPKDLSWAEAAFLAVLPRAPSYLDPYRHRDRVLLRQRALLEALHAHGFLETSDLERSLESPIVLAPISHEFAAPHWVDRVLDEAKLPAGKSVVTTLDLQLQRDVEAIAASHRKRLRDHGADNAAVIVLDNQTGEVLAYLGSLDYDAEHGQVDHANAPRQAGSTLKPFVYGLAFQKGLNAYDLVADVPTRFEGNGDSYAPKNFDGTFHGPLNARTALASSLNVPAVRLTRDLGPDALLTWLRSAGIVGLDLEAEHYGLSLALGSGEVTLGELALAYVTLARGGTSVQLRTHATPAAPLGSPQSGRRLLDAEATAQVTDSLSDPLARMLGLGNEGPFVLEFPLAAKTGTSSGYRDGWTLGYTRERTVGVWTGNSSGAPTRKLTGAAGAGPIFAEVMRRAMRDIERRAPLVDDALLVEVEACPLSGLPVGDACPEAIKAKIPKSRARDWATKVCTVHRHGHEHEGPAHAFACSSVGRDRAVLLPDEYTEWLRAQPPGAPGRDAGNLPWFPASSSKGCGNNATVALRLSEPQPGSIFVADPTTGIARISARAELAGSPEHQGVEFFLDGQPVARSVAFREVELEVSRGDHQLSVVPLANRNEIGFDRRAFSVR